MDDHLQQQASVQTQNSVRDARTNINRAKSGRHGLEPPRTVREQIDELTVEIDGVGHRLRDPLGAAERQHTTRDNSVGGAWIGVTQRTNDERDDVYFEKIEQHGRQRFGDGVASNRVRDPEARPGGDR